VIGRDPVLTVLPPHCHAVFHATGNVFRELPLTLDRYSRPEGYAEHGGRVRLVPPSHAAHRVCKPRRRFATTLVSSSDMGPSTAFLSRAGTIETDYVLSRSRPKPGLVSRPVYGGNIVVMS